MFLQISQPWLLPQRGRRWLCTSLVCLRRGGASTRQSAYFREDFGSDTFRERKRPPTTLSKGNVQLDLHRFLATVNRRIENLLYASRARSQTAAKSLSRKEFDELVIKFRDSVMSNLTQRLEDGKYDDAPARIPTPNALFGINSSQGIVGLDSLILKYFNLYSLTHGHSSLKELGRHNAAAVADMRNPGEWYPGARNMRRKIIMHVGPTNSGKTYQALRRLESANAGWYGGPLRLLAHEIFNRMNNKGIKCNLRTGEEIRIVDINAPITSSTIEMFSESSTYDVAVLDEIQMLADPQRGFAWTSALLGLKAKEIHLCGEEAAVPLVSKIAKELGEEIEVNTYQRLSPLTTESKSLLSYRNIRKGDCVVAFSRKSIFSIREQIERESGLKCALVYGALPPETRSMQADLFNDPDSGYDVIVASDAIGMGLNLTIKRVIFASLEKFDQGNMRMLYAPQIKQIAGRAGRFRSAGVDSDSAVAGDVGGIVTTLKKDDLRALHDGMSTPNPPLEQAMLWPPWRVFEEFTHQFPDGTPLATMLAQFADLGRTTRHYRTIESEPQIILAQAIEHITNIDLESRYSITFAPASTRDEAQVQIFQRFADVLSRAQPVTIESPELDLPLNLLEKVRQRLSSRSLQMLESLHKIITCYCWLSVRWPALYSDYNRAQGWKERVELLIHQTLKAEKFRQQKLDGAAPGPITKMEKRSRFDDRYPISSQC